jgi:hypothetical protein
VEPKILSHQITRSRLRGLHYGSQAKATLLLLEKFAARRKFASVIKCQRKI